MKEVAVSTGSLCGKFGSLYRWTAFPTNWKVSIAHCPGYLGQITSLSCAFYKLGVSIAHSPGCFYKPEVSIAHCPGWESASLIALAIWVKLLRYPAPSTNWE
jgi:hypothetical protein